MKVRHNKVDFSFPEKYYYSFGIFVILNSLSNLYD